MKPVIQAAANDQTAAVTQPPVTDTSSASTAVPQAPTQTQSASTNSSTSTAQTQPSAANSSSASTAVPQAERPSINNLLSRLRDANSTNGSLRAQVQTQLQTRISESTARVSQLLSLKKSWQALLTMPTSSSTNSQNTTPIADVNAMQSRVDLLRDANARLAEQKRLLSKRQSAMQSMEDIVSAATSNKKQKLTLVTEQNQMLEKTLQGDDANATNTQSTSHRFTKN